MTAARPDRDLLCHLWNSPAFSHTCIPHFRRTSSDSDETWPLRQAVRCLFLYAQPSYSLPVDMNFAKRKLPGNRRLMSEIDVFIPIFRMKSAD